MAFTKRFWWRFSSRALLLDLCSTLCAVPPSRACRTTWLLRSRLRRMTKGMQSPESAPYRYVETTRGRRWYGDTGKKPFVSEMHNVRRISRLTLYSRLLIRRNAYLLTYWRMCLHRIDTPFNTRNTSLSVIHVFQKCATAGIYTYQSTVVGTIPKIHVGRQSQHDKTIHLQYFPIPKPKNEF